MSLKKDKGHTDTQGTTISKAQALTQEGFSVIPIKADGTKSPAIGWKPYQGRLPNGQELSQWFHSGKSGIAVIGGEVSRHLEILDFDDPDSFPKWKDRVEEVDSGLLGKFPVVQTPKGGFHVYYRCPDGIEGNLKLASRSNEDGWPKTLIETRGEGGYVLAPGSPLECHPLGKPYELIRGEISSTPIITAEERKLLIDSARALNEVIEPQRIVTGDVNPDGNRPGDDFNRRATWEEILQPHGWELVRHTGQVTNGGDPARTMTGSPPQPITKGTTCCMSSAVMPIPLRQRTRTASLPLMSI